MEPPRAWLSTRLGDVFTGLSARARCSRSPGGEGEAEVGSTQLEGDSAAGDFGFTGHALDQQGMLASSAVVSSNR